MTKEINKGDRVSHGPCKSKPIYQRAMGVGTVIAITGTRVRVKWDRIPRARNYKAEHLILEAHAGGNTGQPAKEAK